MIKIMKTMKILLKVEKEINRQTRDRRQMVREQCEKTRPGKDVVL